MILTEKGNSFYAANGKVFCTFPTSTVAARKAEIAANKVAFRAMVAATEVPAPPVVVTPPPVVTPPVVVVPPPVTTPPIATSITVASLNEVTANLRAGKSVKLKPGAYVGGLDLQYINGPVTLDATGVDLTGSVRMQDTKGITVNGLNLKISGDGIYGLTGCAQVTFDGVSVTGEHKGVGTGQYSNRVAFHFDAGGIDGLSILRCKIQDVLSGVVATVNGDFRLEDTEIMGFGDDGYKVNLIKPDLNGVATIKNILRNTFGIPIETGSGYHSDMGQLTSSGTNSVDRFSGLRVEDNVGYENHDLSAAEVQGLANNFQDGSPLGKLFVDASVKRNLVMCSNGHAISLYNILRGVFEDNTIVNARQSAANIPWITYGSTAAMQAGVTKTRNLESVSKSQYAALFPNWNGIEQPKTRADVIRMLTRR